MQTKWRPFGTVVALASLLMMVASDIDATGVEPTWEAAGWWQWHPQQGSQPLGQIGTQRYFAPGDPQPQIQPSPLVLDTPGANDSTIPDDKDLCLNTQRGTILDTWGCDPDPMGEDLYLDDDPCPNTPPGVLVNAQGCWIVGKILFDSGKADVKKRYKAELKKVYEALGKYPTMRVEVQGYTDSVGSDRYNKRLSLRRAKSVKESLVRLGIARKRLAMVGYGKAHPHNKNRTAKGRAADRRVEIVTKE